jgi:hypothetical protein
MKGRLGVEDEGKEIDESDEPQQVARPRQCTPEEPARILVRDQPMRG